MCLNFCSSLRENSSLVAFPPTIANGQSAGCPVAFQPKTTERASTESGRTSESGELPYLTFRLMGYDLSLYCRDLLYGTLCYDRQYVCFQLLRWLFSKVETDKSSVRTSRLRRKSLLVLKRGEQNLDVKSWEFVHALWRMKLANGVMAYGKMKMADWKQGSLVCQS